MSDYKVAVCSLPGNRLGGARRSLVADLGETLGPFQQHVPCVELPRVKLVEIVSFAVLLMIF